jgi:uncharacterized delta-60 repeat protein
MKCARISTEPACKPNRRAAACRYSPVLERLEDRTLLSPGQLDTMFSGDGKQTVKVSNAGIPDLDSASSVAVQPDGKIVLAGTAFGASFTVFKAFGVVRLNADGTPDLSFSGDGQTISLLGDDDVVRGLALQPDGKIITVGSTSVSMNYEFAILRLNADGTPDSGFGNNGELVIGFDVGGGIKADEASAVVVQPDGKIVVVGSAQVASSNLDFAAVRLFPNGDLDPSFGPGGKRTIAFDLGGNKSDLATCVALQTDGKIVLAGNAQGTGGNADFALARLNSDGTLDASFGLSGKSTISASTADQFLAVALQADGKIVAAGRRTASSPGAFVTRWNTDGKLDTGFADQGSTFVYGASVTGVAIQPDGRIVIVCVSAFSDEGFVVQRRTPTGDYDGTFNIQTIGFDIGGSKEEFAQAVALQPDGKIVVAGSAATGATSSEFAVARLEGANVHFLATGAAPNRVEVFARDGSPLGSFAPFSGYDGGVAVALGDVSGDGTDDLITSATIGNPAVKIYNGRAFTDKTFFANPEIHLIASGFPYAINFNVGTNIAVGDVNGDGFADLVTGAVPGNPHVKVFDGFLLRESNNIPTGDDPSLLAQGFAYGLNFNVGANVAAGDVNGDGFADVITGASAGNPHTRVFDAQAILASKLIPTNDGTIDEFFPYGINFNVGSFVSVADYNHDGFGDVVTGASVGNPEVRVFSGKDITNGTFDLSTSLLDFFFAFEQGQNIGVSVGASDFTGDGKADVAVGTRSGPPRLRVFKNNSPSPATILPGFDMVLDGFSHAVSVAS